MKILHVSDFHLGAKAHSRAVDEFFREVFTKWLFPLIDKHKPDVIIDSGDLFDRRKTIDYQIFYNCRDYYFRPIAERGLPYHVTLGNHDTYFRNTNDVNAVDLILSEYPNVTVYSTPQEIEFPSDHGKVGFLMLPWCPHGAQETWRVALDKTAADVCVGHLDVSGVDTGHGVIDSGSFKAKDFDPFKFVLSGHIHKRHKHRNIHFLGTPYDLVWPQWNMALGVHLLDLDEMELTFLPNPMKLHHKVVYSDRDKKPPTVEHLKGRFVEVIVEHKDDPSVFSAWMDELERAAPASMWVKELLDTHTTDYGDIAYDGTVEDTVTLLKEAAVKAGVNFPGNPHMHERIEGVLLDLYARGNEIDADVV